MKIFVWVSTLLLGLVSLLGGGISIYGGLEGLTSFMGFSFDGPGSGDWFAPGDNEYRFFAGVWVGVGLGLLYCLRNISGNVMFFRFAMLGIFLGGIGRLLSTLQVGEVPAFYGPMAIELILVPLLVLAHARLASAPRVQ